MKIITIPEKVLFQKAKRVTTFGNTLRTTIAQMKRTLEACVDPIGVGLAAPQVGLPLRIFIMKPTPQSRIQTFINPKILNLDPQYLPKTTPEQSHEDAFEGCLSIPRIWGPIKRAQKLTLQWQDATGKEHTQTFLYFEAIIIQHEIDHLDGVLFTHRSAEQKAPLYEEQNGSFAQINI